MNIRKIFSTIFATLFLTGICFGGIWTNYPVVSSLNGNETFLVASGTNTEQITGGNLSTWAVQNKSTNLILTGLPSYSPEIVSIVTNATSTIPSGWTEYYITPYNLATNPFTILGSYGWFVYGGPGNGKNGVYYPNTNAITGYLQFVGVGLEDISQISLGFRFYGNVFAIDHFPTGNCTPMIIVDGIVQYADNNPYSYAIPSDGALEWLTTVTLNTTNWHTVIIKNISTCIGIETPVQFAIEPLLPKTPVYVWGDSVTEGTGAPNGNGSYFDYLNIDPDCKNIWINNMGEGGTGWVNTDPSGPRTNLWGRIVDMQTLNPKYMIISLSNDGGYATNSILTNNTLYTYCYMAMTNIVALFPNQNRLLGGEMPLGQQSNPGDNTWLATQIIRAAGLASGFITSSNQFIDYTSPALITGNAHVGSIVNGTAITLTDPYYGSAFPHPNVEGHYNIAQRIKAAMMANWPELFIPTNSVANLNGSFNGTFTGNGNGLTNVNAGALVGGIGTLVITNAVLLNVSGNGGGLTNLSGYNLVGQLGQQNGVTVTVVQTNASYTTYGYFGNTNWFGYTISGNTYGGNLSLTNSPYFSYWCGYLTNYLAFGAVNGLTGWSDVGPPGAPYAPQNHDVRGETQFIGNSLGLLLYSGPYWFNSDTLPEVQKNWVTLTPQSGNILSLVLTWPNFGFHHIEVHGVGGTIVGMFEPVTNSFVSVQKPYSTGIIGGDSITAGVGSSSGADGPDAYPSILQDTLMPQGINLVPQAEGGTGYIATNIYNGQVVGLPIIQRLTNCILNFHPSFIIWAEGINDPTNGLYAAATNVYLLTKSFLPNCKQIVIAPFPGITSPVGSEAPSDLIISNAAATCGLPVLLPEPNAADSWIQGSYLVPGSGTAYTYYSGNGPHPNAAGHLYYAKQIISFVMANLTTNATPVIW